MPAISGPTKITASGVYTLTQDIIFNGQSGAAIQINASNVTVDLNGFKIINVGASASQTAYGVLATDQSNITITNGTIDGFFWGVRLADSSTGSTSYGNHVVSNLTVQNSTFRGIAVQGIDNRVENNIISGVQGTTVYANAFAAGIETHGPRAQILNNKVYEIYSSGTGEGLGISVSNNGVGTLVAGNVVANAAYDGFRSFGLWVGGGSVVQARDNTFETYTYGMGWSSVTSGSHQNNTFINNINQYVATSTSVVDKGNAFFLPEGTTTYTGRDGNDLIVGTNADDTLIGGDGNDRIDGGAGADHIDGGLGRDTLSFAYSNNPAGVRVSLINPTGVNQGDALGDTYTSIENVEGTQAGDVIYGNNVNNVLDGLNGNDFLFGLSGNDTLRGGDGNDHLFGGLGADVLDGGQGFDYARYDDADYASFVVSLSNPAINTGVAAGDTFISIEGLILSSGDDTAYGNDEANWIYGRDGNDIIRGGGGNDRLFGEGGNDWIYGDAGDDVIYGGDGDDVINGGAGNDILFGEAGNDRLYGSYLSDTLYGGTGNDLLVGDAGNDLLVGEDGNDRLLGGTGNDTLFGGDGDDLLDGSSGDDLLIGGAGADRLFGRGGADVFFFAPGSGNDRIFGFEHGIDKISIDAGYGFADATEVVAATRAVGNTVYIDLDPATGCYIQLVDWLADTSNTIASLVDDILIG